MAQFHVVEILRSFGGEAFEAAIAREALARGFFTRVGARSIVRKNLLDLERKRLVARVLLHPRLGNRWRLIDSRRRR